MVWGFQIIGKLFSWSLAYFNSVHVAQEKSPCPPGAHVPLVGNHRSWVGLICLWNDIWWIMCMTYCTTFAGTTWANIRPCDDEIRWSTFYFWWSRTRNVKEVVRRIITVKKRGNENIKLCRKEQRNEKSWGMSMTVIWDRTTRGASEECPSTGCHR